MIMKNQSKMLIDEFISCSSLLFVLFLVTLVKADLGLGPNTAEETSPGQFPAVFSFGDSILDTGNNNGLATLTKCNFLPYGRDFQGGVPTGRFCNGKVPSDLLGMFTLYMGIRRISINFLVLTEILNYMF